MGCKWRLLVWAITASSNPSSANHSNSSTNYIDYIQSKCSLDITSASNHSYFCKSSKSKSSNNGYSDNHCQSRKAVDFTSTPNHNQYAIKYKPNDNGKYSRNNYINFCRSDYCVITSASCHSSKSCGKSTSLIQIK